MQIPKSFENLAIEDLVGFLNLTFDTSSHAILLTNNDTVILFANQVARKNLALEQTNPVGQSLCEVGLGINELSWQEMQAKCAENKNGSSAIALSASKNTTIVAACSVQCLSISGKSYFFLISESANSSSDPIRTPDTQSVNQATQESDLKIAWQKITQRLTKLEQTANIGTWEVDILADKLIWSDQTRRIHEVPVDYVPDVKTSIGFYKEGYDRDKITEVYQRALDNLVPWDEKLTIVTSKGTERLMRVIGSAESKDGICTRVFGVFQDITDQETIKKDLVESQRMMQDIMDRSPAVVYVKGLDGRYKFINERYLSIFGLNKDQVIGKDDFELLPLKVAMEVTTNDKRVISSKTNMTLEEEIEQLDGTHTYISEKFPLIDSEGRVSYLCGISTDITKQRENEKKLRQAQKMDALGKLSGGIAHDINNLLSIISGHAELIAMDDQSVSATKIRSTLQIAKACERGAHLTKRLLGFSRSQSAKLEVCNVNEIISDSYELLKRLLTASIDFQIETSNELWECEIDKYDFEDALLNLIVNAKQALPERGRIKVTTKNISRQEASQGLLNLDGDFIQITVEDNGSGMDEQIKQRMFEPFFTTKGADGSGLGLSQVYGFLQRCNGEIQVLSVPGKGTTIEMYFPRAQTLSFDSELDLERPSDAAVTSKSIVVVDDEPELTHVMNVVLSANGYKVTIFKTAQEVITHLDSQHTDLLITDIVMPHIDGVELVKRVIKQQPAMKVLFISGYPDRHADQDMYETKIPILPKPFKAAELLNKVNSLFKS